MLTNDGEDFIEFPTDLSLRLKNPAEEKKAPATRAKRSAPAKNSKSGITAVPAVKGDRQLLERNDLREELRQKRLAMAQEKNLKAFQIFNDAVLDELVLKMPVTIEECARIKGIGQSKLNNIMPDFLDIIQRYRRENMI